MSAVVGTIEVRGRKYDVEATMGVQDNPPKLGVDVEGTWVWAENEGALRRMITNEQKRQEIPVSIEFETLDSEGHFSTSFAVGIHKRTYNVLCRSETGKKYERDRYRSEFRPLTPDERSEGQRLFLAQKAAVNEWQRWQTAHEFSYTLQDGKTTDQLAQAVIDAQQRVQPDA